MCVCVCIILKNCIYIYTYKYAYILVYLRGLENHLPRFHFLLSSKKKQKSGWGQLPQLPLKITQHFEEATCTPSVA